MSQQIQLRRGTAAAWTSANSTLAQGEMGIETDTGKFKFGDGANAWTMLAYVSSGGGGSNITLETNGNLNSSQTTLNLVGGSNVTIQDNGSENIEFSVSANIVVSPITLKNNGNLNSSQFALNITSGNNIVLTDTGNGNIQIASTGGGGGGGGFGGGEATLTAPVLSAFTQDNFGGNTSATTITPGGTTAILLTDPGLDYNTNQLRSVLQAIPNPANPWTLTARLRLNSILVSYYAFGLVLKDTTSGKYMQYGWGADSSVIQETDWNSATSFNTDFSIVHPNIFQSNAWWQWQYDGTNLNYLYSLDGNYFVLLKQTAIGSIFLPNLPSEVGFGMNVNNSAFGIPYNAAAMECFSFTLTQP
jgi:hypothetical protein